jgi:hypothetical protein
MSCTTDEEDLLPRYHLCCIVGGSLASTWSSVTVGSFHTDKEAKYYLNTDTFAEEHLKLQELHGISLIYFILSESSTYVVQPGTVASTTSLDAFPFLPNDSSS